MFLSFYKYHFYISYLVLDIDYFLKYVLRYKNIGNICQRLPPDEAWHKGQKPEGWLKWG